MYILYAHAHIFIGFISQPEESKWTNNRLRTYETRFSESSVTVIIGKGHWTYALFFALSP